MLKPWGGKEELASSSTAFGGCSGKQVCLLQASVHLSLFSGPFLRSSDQPHLLPYHRPAVVARPFYTFLFSFLILRFEDMR